MSSHPCSAIVITCIDHRFIHDLNAWLKKRFSGYKNYDRVALAGGVYDFYTILKQIEISEKLHHINKVILINHEDCGAYGKEGTWERHQEDLAAAEKKLEALFPQLDCETYYQHLDGTFEEMSKTNPHTKKLAHIKKSLKSLLIKSQEVYFL